MSLKTKLMYETFRFSRKWLPGRFSSLVNKVFDIFRIKIRAVVQINGIYYSIDTQNYHERGIFCFGEYETQTKNFISNYTKNLSDGYVIDIGANIGIHTLAMSTSTTSSNVQVIAFEANPEMVDKLRLNLALNNISNVHVYSIALNDIDGKFELGLPYNKIEDEFHNPGIASMINLDRAVRRIEVTCKTLDGALVDYGFGVDKVGLIKLDVEGKELDVLRGAEKTLSNSSPAIILEYNNRNFEQICELLSSYGYKKIGSLLRYGIDEAVIEENILFLKTNRNQESLEYGPAC